jgi:glycosyltransferase involved in cell wall biosynthesis
MYNVAAYLPEYFESLERQSIGIDKLEIILVDDGSTDDTAAVAQRFAARHPASVTVLRKENGGQASARNLGLAHATGEWITFPDPDDVLGKHYFRSVDGLIKPQHDEPPAMVTARIRMWYAAESGAKAIRDTHALAHRFDKGTRRVDLCDEPDIIQAHVTTGFFRRDIIMERGLRFREDLRLRFEDGNFVSRYLLGFDRPQVALAAQADYLYRQRADASSLVQSSATRPEKYTDTIRYGYLDVVDAADGRLPAWAQMLIIYDLLWLFRSSQTGAVRRARFPEDMYGELDELLPAIARHLDDDVVREFNAMVVADWMIDAILLLKQGGGHGAVHLGRIDPARGLMALNYRYRGAPPREELIVDGAATSPRYVKDWGLEFAGRPIVYQRTVWTAISTRPALMLDGQDMPILVRSKRTSRFEIANAALLDGLISVATRRSLPSAAPLSLYRRLRRRVSLTVRETGAVILRRIGPKKAIRRVQRAWGAMPLAKEKYASAWVFIDRDVDANDSAEILYKWVVANHPEINAWFAIRKDSADWLRLENEGVRLVDYASPEFIRLLLSAEHVASSHADRFITNPFPRRLGRHAWNFAFLQHGVIKGDISDWLNPKSITTFVTSTQDEYDYITGASAFRYGAKEVRLTGLPRFDELLRQDAKVSADERNAILVMPTWRDYLVGSMIGTSRGREIFDGFADTEYARQLSAFFSSEELAAIVRREDARVVFMPHPNMHAYLDQFRLPDFVEILSYDDVDVRQMLVQARVLVTDYSSIAFNMAYLQRPTVYFQFDRDQYFTNHTERPAYFDYERDGFGPVAPTVADAVNAVNAALRGSLSPDYLQRMQRTFPVRDGQNCRRVFEAMVESRTVAPLSVRLTRAPRDDWSSATSGDFVASPSTTGADGAS